MILTAKPSTTEIIELFALFLGEYGDMGDAGTDLLFYHNLSQMEIEEALGFNPFEQIEA